MRVLRIVAIALCLVGCASVQPWQKGDLAKEQMGFDPDPVDAMMRDHVYVSKEAASGGKSVGGGGCGCN